MICGRSRADTYPDVDLPLGRNVQIRHHKDLLLLIMQRIKGTQPAVVRVIFDTTTDLLAEIVTKLGRGRKAYALFDIRAMPGALQRRVHRPIPTAHILVDDRPYLPRPGVRRIDRPLIAYLG